MGTPAVTNSTPGAADDGMVVRPASEVLSGTASVFSTRGAQLHGGHAVAGVDDVELIAGQAIMASYDTAGRQMVVNYPAGVYYTVDFTASPTTDTAQDITLRPMGLWAVQVSGVGGSPTAWDVRLQVGLDGTSFTQILQHVSGTQVLGQTVNLGLTTIASPARHFRIFLSNATPLNLNGATALRVHVLGVPA